MVRGVFKHLFHFFIVWVFFPHVCLYTVHMYVCTVLTENRRGCWMSWNWNCGRLWVTVNPRSCGRAARSLSWAISPAPAGKNFQKSAGSVFGERLVDQSKWVRLNGGGARRLGAASSVLSGECSEWEHPLMTTVLSSPNQHSTRWWVCTRRDSKHLRNTKPFPNKHWTNSFSQDACDVTYIVSSTL